MLEYQHKSRLQYDFNMFAGGFISKQFNTEVSLLMWKLLQSSHFNHRNAVELLKFDNFLA